MYGKTIFSHNIPALEDGNPQRIVGWLQKNGFEGILLKAANGNAKQYVSTQSPWPTWGENIRVELVNALKNAKIKVFLWHFNYGVDPQGELNIAISQVARFQPDGYIWDVEGSFDAKTNAVANAHLISGGLRNRFPNLHQTLCWWALPKSPANGVEWHPVKVAQAFLLHVDAVMPMMYWGGSGGPIARDYLINSLRVWSTINSTLPMIPVGRAYTGDSGTADPIGISVFSEEVLARVESNNIDGISWWYADSASKDPVITAALAAARSFGSLPILTNKEILNRLIQGHTELFPEYSK
jgi:hypothetical protein